MSTHGQTGFTIIEVILFLGITGALFAGLMVGVNANINNQRYKESVVDLKAVLEEQYSLVEHPTNARSNEWTCSASTIEQVPNGGTARGTSSCVLLGRYAEVKQDGTVIETGDIVGSEPSSDTQLTNDIDALKAYTPELSPIDPETNTVDWQSVLHVPGGGTSSAALLVMRSPLSGLVRVFAQEGTMPAQLADMITSSNATTSLQLCVQGGAGVSPTQSVTVHAAVGSANGIVRNEDDTTC